MRGNCAVVASNAGGLAAVLRDKLRDIDFQVFIAGNDTDLAVRMTSAFPRFLFIEHCFHGYGTAEFIQQTARRYRDVRIAVWAACEVRPMTAARYIQAGAESFFSLRDSEQNIEAVLYRIAGGQRWCPADVTAVLDKDRAYQIIGKEFSEREINVIKLSGMGKTNKEIADCLSVSVHTVKFHKENVYRKLGVKTAVELLINGFKRRIISPEDLYE
jgi:DNA-binding NarL/FixJ family response regulator